MYAGSLESMREVCSMSTPRATLASSSFLQFQEKRLVVLHYFRPFFEETLYKLSDRNPSLSDLHPFLHTSSSMDTRPCHHVP